jgi:hypothetical protein
MSADRPVSPPAPRQERRFARDAALRRISAWTAALAVGGVVGSGAVAVVARAASQPGDSSRTGSSNSRNGSGNANPGDANPGDANPGNADPGGAGGQADGSGGLQPPQDAPVPQVQGGPPNGTSGGS